MLSVLLVPEWVLGARDTIVLPLGLVFAKKSGSIFFLFLVVLHIMWDISSLIELIPPAVEAQSLNHWMVREVPEKYLIPRIY